MCKEAPEFWDSYQNEAFKTALYPKEKNPLVYPALGLVGEIGEFVDKLESGASEELTALEGGDVVWYMGAIATEAKLSLAKVFARVYLTGGVSSIPLHETIRRMVVGAGLIAERVKKSLRDKDGAFDTSDIEEVETGLQLVAFGWVAACRYLGIPSRWVAQTNLEKVKDRLRRGAVKGEGDKR